LLATDLSLADHDIYLFQYVTKDFTPPAIDNIVIQLEFAFRQHLPHPNIVLIAHSMGGLVAMRYILRLLEAGRLYSISGLLLYGVPMTGVEWARYAQMFLGIAQFKFPPLRLLGTLLKTNKQVTQLTTGSEFIDHLNGDWVVRVLNGGYPRINAEQRAWVPVRVVSGNDDWVVKESSARGFYSNIDWLNVDQNHIRMVKPRDRNELAYQIARDFLHECRAWMDPPTLLKLRRQMDAIWNLHRVAHIANWQFDLDFDCHECVPAAGFGLAGYRPFTVVECSYHRRLEKTSLKFGFANGEIAAGKIWSEDFVFLHSLRFGALAQADRQAIQDQLGDVLRLPGETGWQTLFRQVRITARLPNEVTEYDLDAGPLENLNDGLVRLYSLPAAAAGLAGQDVVVNVRFQSLLPKAITDYAVEFPWLCDGFAVSATVQGGPGYFIASQAFRGSSRVETTREVQRRIEYTSADVALPGSRIQFEWKF
jgi:pimeloyl-ACP methyl ester carboxylesterase